MLNKLDATVSICHSKTQNLKEYVKRADIVISAVGKKELIKGSWFKEGAIAIDVGINYLEEEEASQRQKTLVGDIEFDKAIEVCSHITPVPGGVGPMTIAMLMSNIVKGWKMKNF